MNRRELLTGAGAVVAAAALPAIPAAADPTAEILRDFNATADTLTFYVSRRDKLFINEFVWKELAALGYDMDRFEMVRPIPELPA
jgi:hypothetical protein